MTWTLMAHRSELKNPGDYVNIAESVCYNKDGQIIVADNKCKHRGARIFSQHCGNGPLTCPYHGFKGDKVMTAQYLTQWVGDWLFAGEGHEPIDAQLGDLKGLLEGASEKIDYRYAFDSFSMPCDWKVAVENALEDLHIASIHPDTFGKYDLRMKEQRQVGKNSIAVYQIGDERTVRGLQALGAYFEKVEPELYFHALLWPGTAISSFGGLTFSVQHYFPESRFTKFHTRLYKAKTKPGAPNLNYFLDEAVAFNRTVFAQDTAICATVAGAGNYLTEAEERVKWFRLATPEFQA